MSTFYARKGLLGVMTPQANTTVEPEMSLLLPDGFGMIAARLTSTRATMHDRLLDYFDTMGTVAARFANAPVAAIGFACTGASYLAGAAREAAQVAQMTRERGVPVITTGAAIADALRALSARRLSVVSPYGDALTDTCLGYWAQHGFEIAQVSRIREDGAAFHPIYAHSGDVALTALRQIEATLDGDAVVMLGTGLPTLAALAVAPFAGASRVPVLSSNLCLAWRLVRAAEGAPPDGPSLRAWLEGRHWSDRVDRVLAAGPTNG
jgi:maleate cis-trans isomerase